MFSNDFDYRSVVFATIAINSWYLHYMAGHVGVVTSSPYTVKLSWQHSCINKMTYKASKLGQTGLVFGL